MRFVLKLWNKYPLLRFLLLLIALCWFLHAMEFDAKTWIMTLVTYTIGVLANCGLTTKRGHR